MPSAFCCVTCHQPGTNYKVPTFIPVRVFKHRISWERLPGVRASNLCGPTTVGPLQPDSCRMASVVNLRYQFGAGTPLCTCRAPLLMVNTNLGVNTYSCKLNTTGFIRSAHKLPWERMAAFTLSVTIALGGQPAYADFEPALQADLYQMEEMMMRSSGSSESSVEAILARQLARRFREMSDEELVDILQQLLKASRSSLQSGNAIPQQSQQPGEKKGGRGHASDRDLELPEAAPNFGNITAQGSSQSEGQPSKGQSNRDKDTGIQGEESSSQVGRKASGSTFKNAEDVRKQGQAILQDKTNNEVTAGGESSQTQANGTSLSRLPGAERKTDIGEGSNLSVPDATRATEAPKLFDKVFDDGGENSSQPENATELLLAEWSRRATPQPGQEFERLPPDFNSSDIWRNMRTYGEIVGDKVIRFTGSVLEAYKDVLGVAFVSLISLVSAFYFGRSRSTSKNNVVSDTGTSSAVLDARRERSQSGIAAGRGYSKLGSKISSPDSTFSSSPRSESILRLEKEIAEDRRGIDGRIKKENSDLTGPSMIATEGVMTVDSGQPESRKWWQRRSNETSSSNKEEAPGKILPRAIDGSQLDSKRSGEGRRPDWSKDAGNLSKNLDGREFGTRKREGSLADSTSVSGKAELRGQEMNTNASVHPIDLFYSPTKPMMSPERSLKEPRQASIVLPRRNGLIDQENDQDYRGQRDERAASLARVDFHEERHRDVQNAKINLRMDNRNPGHPSHERKAVLGEEPIIKPNSLNHSGRGDISSSQSDESITEDKNGDALSPVSHQKQNSPDSWRRVKLSGVTKASPGFGNQMSDTTNGFTAVTNSEGKDVANRDRKAQNLTPPEDHSDYFVHRGVLWVRDSDGVFVRHDSDREEMTSIKMQDQSTIVSQVSEGSLKIKKQERENADRSQRKTGLLNGFDYRELIISSNGKFTTEYPQEVTSRRPGTGSGNTATQVRFRKTEGLLIVKKESR